MLSFINYDLPCYFLPMYIVFGWLAWRYWDKNCGGMR